MNVTVLQKAVPQGGDTVLCEIDVQHFTQAGFEIKNGLQAFDAFKVSVKFGPNGNYVILAQAAADYTSPTGYPVKRASGDLTVLGIGATGWLFLDLSGVHMLKIEASCGNVAGTLVDMHGVIK